MKNLVLCALFAALTALNIAQYNRPAPQPVVIVQKVDDTEVKESLARQRGEAAQLYDENQQLRIQVDDYYWKWWAVKGSDPEDTGPWND